MSGPPLMRLALTSPAANTLLIAPVVTWSLSVKRWARQTAWAASSGAKGEVEKTTRSSRISTTRRDLNSGRRRRAEASRPRNRLHGHFHRDFMGFLRQPGDHDTPASARMRLRRALAHGFASPRHRGFALFGNRSNTDSSERTIAWERARTKRTKASRKVDERIFPSSL